MTKFKCFCTLCESEHLVDMEPEEFRRMITSSPNAVTESGHLIFACDLCVPPGAA